jgi:hypothetical protein
MPDRRRFLGSAVKTIAGAFADPVIEVEGY